MTPQEWEYYGPMILPRPGDGPDVLAQKAQTRRQMVEDITVGLGNMGGLVSAPGPETRPQPAGPDDASDLLKKYGIE